jgi:medium-chain acyl-[acyl-carrier-protein] hydrolase
MSKWVVDFAGAADSRFRLFCFHCAGGSAGQFRPWAAAAKPQIRITGVQLPGREGRFGEAPLTEMRALIERLGPELRPCMDGPFALFGHSLGALIAFELTRWLREVQWRLPMHLFVASRPAPQIRNNRPALDLQPVPELLRGLADYGGIDSQLLNEEGIGWFLPTIRADFRLNRTYRHEFQEALPVAITAFNGSDDPFCGPSEIEAWSAHTSGQFSLHTMPGAHFFLRSQYPGILAHVLSALTASGPTVATTSASAAGDARRLV